jgi:hypothetical protein
LWVNIEVQLPKKEAQVNKKGTQVPVKFGLVENIKISMKCSLSFCVSCTSLGRVSTFEHTNWYGYLDPIKNSYWLGIGIGYL